MAEVLSEVIAPALQRFQPDILLVSAGYDAHWRDPLAGLQFQSRTYHRTCAALKEMANELCGGRCVFILEGGYDLEALSEAVTDSFAALVGETSIDTFHAELLREEPREKVNSAISLARSVHGLS
ncbi:hypothetical protein CYMTET_32321 [Cymbomonas tetramitiformis]|uniref:Histone deacetylase domain-containing protein n=1 Tax=Cymbomonas tetramitiformis TaxID=36881 RepID=A0AAE0FFW0_9CHLO|nr:hypothetical protein CYMTET_32321 [Cymbomonas tetramitiformis]